MALKTDYKDAMFDGDRKYRITANADGTSRISDETEYTQEGDFFGANDVNATNKAVNHLNHTTQVTLTAAGWTGSAAPVHPDGGRGWGRRGDGGDPGERLGVRSGPGYPESLC